jgi:exopolysaccharide biosynthesis polyprenyl glycosylphosphotransferase
MGWRTRGIPVAPWRGGLVVERSASQQGRFDRMVATADALPSSIFEAPPSPEVSARDRRFRRFLVVADGLSAVLALLVAVTVVGDDALRPAAALLVPLTALVSKVIGLYDRDELLLRKSTLDEVPALLELATAYTLLAWVCSPLVIDGVLGRAQGVGLWALLVVASVCGRATARALARRTTPVERCLLVGDAATSRRVARALADGVAPRAELVRRIMLSAEHDLAGALGEVEHALVHDGIHRVVLAPHSDDGDGVLDAVQLVKAMGAKVSLLPRVFEVVGSSVEFDHLGGMTVLGLRRFGLTRSSWFLKRGLDWIGGLTTLILLAPLAAVIAIAIKLDSPGPVLFRQTRVGRDGRRFQMLKFRTMVDGADALKAGLLDRNEADGLFKIADDPRTTRVGRILRRASLDELPQLVNVLRGEMSLVGPRPLVVDEDSKVQGWHRRRLQLTPGMTGPWQILGSARIPLSEMVKIDYLYVANWSLWGDVKILLRTLPYLVRRRGM